MNLVKCENGHYYNAEKLASCPHCANEKIHVPVPDLTGARQSAVDTYIPEKQISEKYKKAGTRPLAGWLVCIDGNMKGDCFTLFTGTNSIGRDTSMDVALFQEPTVLRYHHATITYHTDTAEFTLSTKQDSTSTVFCNEQPITPKHSITLAFHDRITVGRCTLAFIPFCCKDFQWE